jgi:hypothetical protein
MATFDKILLSGSTGGRPIKIAATGTPGTTIHATGTSATVIDEVWLYVTNTATTAEKLTIEFGGTSAPDDLIEFEVEPESGLFLMIPGIPLTGDGSSARTVSAFAATTNVLNILGYVNRITP